MPELPMGGMMPGGPGGGIPMAGMSLPNIPQEASLTVDSMINEFGGDIVVDSKDVRKEEAAYEENVQYALDKTEKAKIAEYVISLVDKADADRAEWKSIRKESLDLVNGIREPKSDPWPNCSNITTMATATHCKLIHAKLFPTVWNENLVHWRPVEKSDVDNVAKVSKFMGWVVGQKMKMQDQVDDILWDLIVNGTIALKTRWVNKYITVAEKNGADVKYKEIAEQTCVVDNIPIDEIYLPNLWKGVDESEFTAQDIYMRLPEIKDLASRNIYDGVDIEEKLIPKLDEKVPDSLRKQKEEIEGTNDTIIDATKDGMAIRLIECYVKWLVDGEMKESVFTIAYESKAYLSGKPLSAVNLIGRRPFVIGQFMRRTGRPYGVGLPENIRGLAKELDAIHNQRIDAGSIGIAPFGFYRAASSYKPENVEIGPGVMIPVDDIKDVNIITMNNNPVASFQEERIIVEYLEKLTSVSAYQMGRESDIVKSRATATGTMNLIAQGEQAFNILSTRTQSILSRLLTQILQQYQMFMPKGYADKILGEDPGKLLFPGGLTPVDIMGQYDAYMTPDVTGGNKVMEKSANAALVQMGPQLMSLSQDPRGYEMAKDFLISMGKVDVEKYIGPKPKPRGGATAPAGPPMGPGLDVGGGQGGPSGGFPSG